MSASFADGLDTVSTLIVILFFSVAQVLFYWQVPGLASALGGGLQLHRTAPTGVSSKRPSRHRWALRSAASDISDHDRRLQSDRIAGVPEQLCRPVGDPGGGGPGEASGRARAPLRGVRQATLLVLLTTAACAAPQPPSCDGRHREPVNAEARHWP